MKFFQLLALYSLLFLQITQALGAVRDFQTTRLKGTGGTGLGSILMDEATILNPASLAFFNNTSIYYQEIRAKASGSGDASAYSKPKSSGIIVSDANSGRLFNGSLSYLKQEEFGETLRTLNVALAMQISAATGLGLTYSKHKNEYFDTPDPLELRKSTREYLHAGLTNVLSKSLSVGFLVRDIFAKDETVKYAGIGFQYTYQGFATIMADVGGNYEESLSDSSTYHLGTQLNVYSDLYLRLGTYQDKANSEKGNGLGLCWLGPKLLFDFSISHAKIRNPRINQATEFQLKETSFSVAYYF